MIEEEELYLSTSRLRVDWSLSTKVALIPGDGSIYATADMCDPRRSSLSGGRHHHRQDRGCTFHSAPFDVTPASRPACPAKIPVKTYPSRSSTERFRSKV